MSKPRPEGANPAGSRQPSQDQPKGAGRPKQGGGSFMGPKGDPAEGKRSVGVKPKA